MRRRKSRSTMPVHIIISCSLLRQVFCLADMPGKKKKKQQKKKEAKEAATGSPSKAPEANSAAQVAARERKLMEQTATKTNKEIGQEMMLTGVRFKNEGNTLQAQEYYRKSLTYDPSNPLAWYNLGVSYAEVAMVMMVMMMMMMMVMVMVMVVAWYNLGVSYAEDGRIEAARKCYESAVKFEPKFPFALNNLATYYKDRGELDQALQLYQRALAVEPNFYNALNNISVVYHMQGQLGQAQRFCEMAVDSNPKDPEAHNNLASFYLEEGRGKCPYAVQEFERCIQLDPNKAETMYSADHNRLLAMNFLGGHDDGEEREDQTSLSSKAHMEWGRQYEAKYPAWYDEWPNDLLDRSRPIRVGYLSSDFRTHPVADFIEAPLKHMDLKEHGIETFCYLSGAGPDARTAELRTNIDDDHFRELGGRSVREVCDLIRADKIDILVELGGHSAGNRLDIMVRQPSPVQVTWIGYPNTTGMKRIHYRISDPVADPLTSKQPHSEILVRMPEPCGFSCYTGSKDVPDVPELAALKNGHLTFGSFTLLSKVTTGSFALWCAVLK
eukprot:g63409.t1